MTAPLDSLLNDTAAKADLILIKHCGLTRSHRNLRLIENHFDVLIIHRDNCARNILLTVTGFYGASHWFADSETVR